MITYPGSTGTASKATFKSSPAKQVVTGIPINNETAFCQYIVVTLKAKGNEEIQVSVKADGAEVGPVYIPVVTFSAETEVGKEKIANIVFTGQNVRANSVPFFVKAGGFWQLSVVKGAPELFASILTLE